MEFYSFCSVNNNSNKSNNSIEKILTDKGFVPKSYEDGIGFRTPAKLTKDELEKRATDLGVSLDQIVPK